MKHYFLLSLFIAGFVVGCAKKEEPAPIVDSLAISRDISPSVTSTSHCCADSTNEYPESVPNAFWFKLLSSCTVGLDVTMSNSGGATEKFTLDFTKDGAPYVPVGESLSTITIIVPPAGSVSQTYNCAGSGSFLVTATCTLNSGPGTWITLYPVDPPPSAIVGPITDTSYVPVEANKQWKTKTSGVKASATFSICRYEGVTGMMMMKAPSASKSEKK